MQSTNAPTKMPVPFADSGTKNTVPIPSQIGVTPGAASFTTGFPPLNFTPISAGGVPPFGADFNGVFNAITQALRWSNAGGQYTYDADFATSVGGYPKGALLQRSTLDGFWLNNADNNATDPDAGGAGWADPLSGRLINIQEFNSSGTYTPTAGTRSVVVEVQGGGGGGGGVGATGSAQFAIAGGGGSGAYAKSRLTAGFSGLTVTIGSGGTGGGAGANSGNVGGTSSFGALISCTGGPGGSGGIATPAGSAVVAYAGGSLAVATGGNIVNAAGRSETVGVGTDQGACISGAGNASTFGGGGHGVAGATSSGVAATSYGSGGGGACAGHSGAAQAGGNGGDGLVLVWEYA